MESLTATHVDVQLVQSKLNPKLMIISGNPEQKSQLITQINLYETLEFNEQIPVIKVDILPNFKKVNINKINKKTQYLNFENNQKINQIQLINKFVVEQQIDFAIPAQLLRLYYHCDLKTEKVYMFTLDVELLPEFQDNITTLLGRQSIDFELTFVEFIQLLSDFNSRFQAVFLLGFEMSKGIYLHSFNESVSKIPIYKVFLKCVDHFQPIVKFGVKQYETKNGILIQGFQSSDIELERIYFIDISQLVFESFTKQQIQYIEYPSIISYQQILTGDIDIFNAWQTVQEHTADYFKTLINNLKQLSFQIESNQIIERKLSLITLLNVPLSYALYQTPVTCISQYLFRQYFNQGWLFSFKQPDDDYDEIQDDLEQNGGIFEIADTSNIFKVVNNVFEGDYFSLYPTIILAYNISVDTLVPADQIGNYNPNSLNKLVLNYRSNQSQDQQKFVYFLKREVRQGIFPKLAESLIQERKNAQPGTSIYTSLKILLASIYGLIGMKRYSLYNSICQKVICSQGRRACDIARDVLENQKMIGKGSVLARFTDSCQFVFAPNTRFSSQLKNLKETWPKIQQQIQKLLGSDLFNFQLEPDLSVFKLQLSQKNSQISIKVNHQQDYEILKKDMKACESIAQLIKKKNFKIKGCIKWNKFRPEIRKEISQIMLEILFKIREQQDKEINIPNIVHEFMKSLYKLVEKDAEKIKNAKTSAQFNNVKQQILAKYSTCLKFSLKEETCKYLANIYGITKQVWIVPFISSDFNSSKRLSEGYIPLDIIGQNHQFSINYENLKNVYNPIKVFFGIKTGLFQNKNDIQSRMIKSAKPDCNQCQLRIENLYQNRVRMTFGFFNIDDVYQLVINNPKKSFHEVMLNPINKMYFDIDSKHMIDQHQVCTEIMSLVRVIDLKIRNIAIHVASAHKTEIDDQGNQKIVKWSFHCVLNIACTKAFNYFIALQLDKKLNDQVDTKVYTSTSSLRLPMTPKIDNKKSIIEHRLFTFNQETSKYKDFVITDISECIFVINENALFDKRPPLTITKNFGSVNPKLVSYSLEQLKQLTGRNSWIIRTDESKKYLVNYECSVSYKCPVCKSTHDNDNMFGIIKNEIIIVNCYSNNTRKNNLCQKVIIKLPVQDEEPLETSDNEQGEDTDDQEETKSTGQLEVADQHKKVKHFQYFKKLVESIEVDDYRDISVNIQSERFVSFDLSAATTYVVSGMGTGKSTELIGLLKQYQESTIICLSFRITFTSEFSKKYNLTSYQNIDGQINLTNDPRIIIQVDSLFRLNENQFPDLLIIDEIESILEKIQSSGQRMSVISQFDRLLKQSKKVVIMDGLMEKMSIKYLNIIRDSDNFQIVYNTEMTRGDYTLQLFQYHSTQFQFVLNMFIDYIQQGKKIYGMITQKKLGEYICEQLKLLKIQCIYYNGNNLQVNDNMETHQDVKQRDFSNVNEAWAQYQVVLHSSTVTAGISFDIKNYFDLQINVLNSDTCSAISFVQGCHRVRSLTEKLVITFIEPYNQQGEHIPLLRTLKEFEFFSQHDRFLIDITDDRQIQTWLDIREQMSSDRIVDLVVKYAKSMGYKIVPNMIPEDFKGSAFKPDSMLISQMKSIEITRTFDTIKTLDIQFQQAAAGKFELARFYHMFDYINQLDEAQLKYLTRNKYIQEYRLFIVNQSPLIEYNEQTHTEEFWLNDDNWLLNVKFPLNCSFYGVDPIISDTILKAKKVLQATSENNINIDQFDTLCQSLKFDVNQLGKIQRLKIATRFKKSLNVTKLSATIIKLMILLCYDYQFKPNTINDSAFIEFNRYNMFNKLGLERKQQEPESTELLI